MKITILGCGPSYGLPSLSRGFGQCDPDNPKNTRTRSSILIQEKGKNILIDSAPEMRLQLLKAGSPPLCAVLYTHEHFDHMGGAEDLKNVRHVDDKLPIYACEKDEKMFKKRLDYLFDAPEATNPFEMRRIEAGKPFDVDGLRVLPLQQYHGAGTSLGFRIGPFAYSTDARAVGDHYFDSLAGIDVWILGVVTPNQNTKHITLDEALQWIDRVRPKRAYLTHLGARMDYDRLKAALPDTVEPVYDGMEIFV